jgi:hypothetical protein
MTPETKHATQWLDATRPVALRVEGTEVAKTEVYSVGHKAFALSVKSVTWSVCLSSFHVVVLTSYLRPGE